METYMQFVPYKQQQGEQQYALLQKFNSLLNFSAPPNVLIYSEW